MWRGSLVTICFHSPHPANVLKHLHALTLLWLAAVLKEETEKQRVWESFGVLHLFIHSASNHWSGPKLPSVGPGWGRGKSR